jgi:REP element-mobilizing transposase RayT
MRYNPDVQHRRSIRLKGQDYAQAGEYFVTMCVQGRESLLGEVVGGEVMRNKAGEMVRQTWLGLGERFLNLTIDEFVAMPNHFHGILFLTDRRDVARFSGENRAGVQIPDHSGIFARCRPQ